LTSAIRHLGEIALRVNDLGAMRTFYRNVIGLEEWRAGDDHVFFRVAEAVEGHPQALVLFDRGVEVAADATTLDHIAFVIALEDYDERLRELEGAGLEVTCKTFESFHWRSLFVEDPERNRVEFVCYDPSV
jgi:catechol-2,3-dioxygenase